MANIIEAIQARCNELRDVYLPIYDELPEHAGVFAATMIRQSIKNAEAAIASGDAVECVAALKYLQEYKL